MAAEVEKKMQDLRKEIRVAKRDLEKVSEGSKGWNAIQERLATLERRLTLQEEELIRIKRAEGAIEGGRFHHLS